MSTPIALERAVEPLDVLRRHVMRFMLRYRLGVFVIGRRDRRIAAQATVGVLLTFALVCIAPVLLLVAAPIVLGVPHLASDVRYLMLRRRVSRGCIAAAIACAVLITLSRVTEMIAPGAAPFSAIEIALAAGWVGAALAAGLSAGGRTDRIAPALVGLGGLAVIALLHPFATRLVIAHAHNLIAIVLWLVLFRRYARAAVLPLAAVSTAVAVLLSGAVVPFALAHGSHAMGMSLAQMASWLAPGFAPHTAIAIALCFAFLQEIHYAVWLGWIPQEDVKSEGTISFKMSVRSLRRDFGAKGLALVLVVSALVIVAGCFAADRTRTLYLSLAAFHGYFELAMLAYFLCSRPEPAARRAGHPRAGLATA